MSHTFLDRQLSTGLIGADISGLDLRGANMRETNLRDVDFTGADFTGSKGTPWEEVESTLVDLRGDLQDVRTERIGRARDRATKKGEDLPDFDRSVQEDVRSSSKAEVERLLQALRDEIGALEGEIDAWSDEVEDAQEKLDEVTVSLDAANERISELEQELEALKAEKGAGPKPGGKKAKKGKAQ